MTKKDLSSKARVGILRLAQLTLVAAFITQFVPPAPLAAQVDCTLPGRNTPAVPAPECVDVQGFTVTCETPRSIRLWPDGFHPASDIPLTRDSTDRVAGNTLPSRSKGHESFASVDVVTAGGISRRLHVAYTGGIQVWDIETDPANPIIRGSRDGWAGEFLKWAPVGEKLHFLEDISAVSVSPTTDVIAASGFIPAGVSFWEFNAATTSYKRLYQDEGIDARQVRLVQLGTTIYAVVGSNQGVAVYNVTTARGLASGCLDNQGTNAACNGVFRGYVTQQGRQYVDAMAINNRLYVSSSNGTSFQGLPIELWELATPQSPVTAVLRMSESRNSAGSALFGYNGHYYLGLVDEAGGFDKEELRVLLIDDCVQGFNCSLALGTVEDSVTPISLDPPAGDGADYGTTRDFLTYSEFAGKPYLYYGVATGGLQGPDMDRLFDLGSLRPPNPLPLSTFPEVTAGGGSYTDPCNGARIHYWSHYYSRNFHGLNDMVPRIGQLSSGGYFYRVASTILDVHVVGNGTQPGTGGIETKVATPQTGYWMSDVVGYTATETGGCTPSPLLWDWTASSSRTDVAPTQITEVTSTASYSFDCNALSRCPDALVTVLAANGATSCLDATLKAATITVKDPEIAIVAAGTGVTDTFEECQTVPFSASLAGRAPAWWEWRIDGNSIDGCSSTYSATDDLAAAVVGCDVPAELISSDTIFRDTFESGGIGAWSLVVDNGVTIAASPATKAAGPVLAELHVWDTFNTALPATDVAQVPFTIAASGTPAFSGAPLESVVGSSATLTHPATDATSWAWEIQDPAGTATCTFPGVGTASCHQETTSTDSTTHVWLAAGAYEYRVTISNCGPSTASRTDQVTVEAGVQPSVQLFNVQTGARVCSGNLISGYTCTAGCEYDFAVKMAENAVYAFKLDWARTSATGTPSFAPENPASNDPSKLEWYFKHTFSQTGNFYPKVRAENGSFFSEKDFITVGLMPPLPIAVVNGTCN